MAGIANDVKQIRQALYGREVREAIAHGIEQCYSDVTASKTVADTAAAAANTATQNAQTATQQANQARDNAQAVADGVVNQSITAINDAAAQQRQSVNDLGDQLKSYMSEHYSETITKAEAKANRSSVSAIKHAIGAGGQLTLTDALNEPAKKMTIHLEPKQDLRGYDHPWVGGAGKNLLPMIGNTATWAANANSTYTATDEQLTIVMTDDTSSGVYAKGSSDIRKVIASLNGVYTWSIDLKAAKSVRIVIGIQGTSTIMTSVGTDWQRFSGTATFTGASNPFVIYNNGGSGTATTVYARNIMIESGSVASTYEPYSNICPIEGYDSVEVVGTGKNLFPPNNWANGSINTSGNNFASDYGIRQVDFHHIDPDADYTFSASGASDDCALFVYDKNYNLSVRFQLWSISNGNGHYASFRTPSDAAYYKVRLTGSDYRPDRNMNMQLEYGTTATDYEPYQGNTVNVNLVSSAGSTVYGGTVTVNEDGSGTLVVDRASVTLSGLDTSKVSYSTSTKTFYVTPNVAPGIAKKDYTAAFTGICDKFEPYPGTPAWSANTKPYIGYGSDLNFRFAIPGKTEVADVLDVLNGTTVTYYLATPATYQLTATQLQILVGTNHIWTDGTSIDLDYYADKYADIDKLYAALPKDTATGNPAIFTDGADGLPLEKLEVAIEPKQDLHGYDHPWVGGAGKNVAHDIIYSNSTDQYSPIITGSYSIVSGKRYVISFDTPNTGVKVYRQSPSSLGFSSLSDYFFTLDGSRKSLWGIAAQDLEFNNHSIIVKSEKTDVESGFCSNFMIEEVGDGVTVPSEYAPYENICPIAGWDEAVLTRTGKNLLNVDEIGTIETANGERIGWVFDKPGTYTLKNNKLFNGSTAFYVFVKAGTSYGTAEQILISSNTNAHVYTINEGQVLCVHGGSNIQKPTVINYVKNAQIQLEYGSTATAYEPYVEQTIKISLRSISGSTVYGGKLVVNRDGSGELVVDRAIVSEEAFQQIFSKTNNANTNYASTYNIGSLQGGFGVTNLAVVNNPNAWNMEGPVAQVASDGKLRFYGVFDTVATFREKYKGLQFVYELANPTTYTLTAPQITTLLGTNHISCDAGEVTVTYHADPTLFITKKIAQALNA